MCRQHYLLSLSEKTGSERLRTLSKSTESIELESSQVCEILIPMILASLKGGCPNEQGGDFDGEFTGWEETSHLRGECGSETDSAADGGKGEERGLSTQGSCLPCPSDFTFLAILVSIVILLVALFLGTLTYLCVWRKKRKQSRKCGIPGCVA